MHRCSNERRTVYSGAVDRLAFDRNTHDPDARADRQPHHARTHDRQPHHALSDNAEPHHARANEPASDGSALDDDRVADAAAILRPELRAEPVAIR